MQAATNTLRARSGGLILAIAVHVVVIYAIASTLGIVRAPLVVKPMEAVIIDQPQEQKEFKPVETKPNLAEPTLDMAETVPEVPVEIPLEEAPPVVDTVTTAPSPPAEVQNLSVKNRVEPVYPAASRRAGEQGTGVFRVLVSERGQPVEVSVVQSSGFPRLDQAAMEAIKRWRFAAATNGSTPVTAYTTVRVTFRLDS
jgi:periplasmic protein TonB